MADDATVRALLAGPAAWAHLRDPRVERRARFRERRESLGRTEGNISDFADVKPVRPDLTHANLRRAQLSGLDLYEADLRGADLSSADLREANLRRVDLSEANLRRADLRGAVLADATLRGASLRGASLEFVQLRRADLRDADLREAILRDAKSVSAELGGANLTGARLDRADLSRSKCQRAILRGANLQFTRLANADLTGADLTEADLTGASLVGTWLTGATLRGSRVYGASVWDVDLTGAVQTDLVASPLGEPDLVTDRLEVAQFLYLLLKNPAVRAVIDTIGRKAVLILGRFSPERKAVLEAVRERLRGLGWVPILFDFERPSTRDMTETVATLAHLSRFVIADLTDPHSLPQELTRIVPILPSLAVQPIIHASQDPWVMFGDLRRYPWVLEPYRYESVESLVAALEAHVVGPAEAKAQELTGPR